MKKLIQLFSFATLLMMGGVTVVSCDPCAGIVCMDGYCSNGICLCNDGYDRLNGGCTPINSKYTGEDLNGTQTWYNTFLSLGPDTKSVTYTFEASETNPSQIILKAFLGYVGNDLPLTIDFEKRNIFVEELILPVGITNGTITNPSFLPIPYRVSGTIDNNIMDITLKMGPAVPDSLETEVYRLVMQR